MDLELINRKEQIAPLFLKGQQGTSMRQIQAIQLVYSLAYRQAKHTQAVCWHLERGGCVPFASCSSSCVLCVVLGASITPLRAQHCSPLHQFAAPLAIRTTYHSNHQIIWTISITCQNVCSLSVKSSFFMFLTKDNREKCSLQPHFSPCIFL